MTENEQRFERFLREATIKGGERVLVASAWAKCSTDLLTTPIPTAQAEARGWPADRTFTLEDFALIAVHLDDGQSVFLLSAKDFSCEKAQVRREYTSADDLAVWVEEIAPFGLKEADLLTDAEARALIGED